MRSAGRVVVVLETTKPSTRNCSDSLAISSNSSCDKSGDSLTKIGNEESTRSRACKQACSRCLKLSGCCQSRKPCVLGDEMLMTQKSANGPNTSILDT